MTRAFVYLICFACIASTGVAQLNGNLQLLDVSDGLSNGTVHTIFQDSEGLMWFGTTDGLNCFNGYDFKSFHSDELDSNSISSNFVTKIAAKSNNELWIATHSDLNIFSKKTGSFTAVRADPTKADQLSNSTLTDLALQGEDYLWIATAWGLNKMQTTPPYKVVRKYHTSNGLSNDHINCLLLDSTDLWIGTNNGISVLDVSTGKFKSFSLSQKEPGLTSLLIRDITKDSHGSFWIATENGANRYFPRQDSLVRFFPKSGEPGSLEAKIVQTIYEDSDGNIWLGTDGAGIYRYDSINHTFIENKRNSYHQLSLTTNAIYSIYESREDILWIGTYEKGLHMYDRRKSLFHTYSHDPFFNSIGQGSIKAAYQSARRNGIWLGTSSEGVNFFDMESGTFASYRHNDKDTSSLSTDIIKSLYEDVDGKLWVGTFTGGLNIFDPEKNTNTIFPVLPKSNATISSTHIWDIYKDSNEQFWIGTLRGGLLLFDPVSGKSQQFINDPLDSTSIASNLISVIYEDSRGNLWVGNEEESGGLNLLDRKRSQFKRYIHDPNDVTSISHNFVREIYEDSNHNLWIGTSQGLNLFNYQTESFSKFNHISGLDGIINDILEDDAGYLWISTNEGLLRFNPQTFNVIHFDAHDGLQGKEFNYNTALKLDDGRLFFAGLHGFNLFDPSDIVTQEGFPKVILTDFKLKEKPIEPGSSPKLERNISYTDYIELDSDESTLSISFAAINYHAPQKIRYAYKLEGLERDWRFVGHERKASYTNLDPGTYTFLVKASNTFGKWGNNITRIKIRIRPAWFETVYFHIFLGLFATGAVFGLLQIRTRNLSSKKLMLQQMVKERTAEIEELNTELANSNKSLQYINQTLVNQRNELKRAVSELKVTRDRLVISEKMASIGVFTAGIAHELNNPINYVSGATKLLCEIVEKNVSKGKFDTEEFEIIEELQSTIQMGVEKTADIVKSLRNYVHEDAENFKPFNLLYCIDDALKLLKSEYKDRITIHKDLPDVITIDCLPGRVNQIIVNLLSNAIDAITGDGHIYVSANYDAESAWLKIRDTGEGIPEKMLAKLYDPFFTTKEVGKGMGLGLYIVYGLVDMHNGKITVNSAQGIGTEFLVELPIKQQPTEASPKKPIVLTE